MFQNDPLVLDDVGRGGGQRKGASWKTVEIMGVGEEAGLGQDEDSE